MPHLPTYIATRYVQPLREGGTLPAVVETHGGGLFVAKFRGAGQGAKALVAELLVGMIGQAAGLPVPELALIELLPDFGQTEPDPEIQDLLKASVGINVGMRYLDGAFNFQAASAGDLVTPELAARVVWLDAFTTNPDRTARNPNLMVWDRKPWLIDHGAALYAQHNWPTVDESRTRTPFPLIKDHVLLRMSSDLEAADAELSALLTEPVLTDIVARLPDALLSDPAVVLDFATPDAARERYLAYLLTRIASPRAFVAEATAAKSKAVSEPPRRLHSRR
ncbi:HipA family kinase [Longimicrobium sp.]|uniref:HipA family kinase n=1 Tax=Longimicrobium sp. TaxID=2029185 RepID=UPI003B3AAB4A